MVRELLIGRGGGGGDEEIETDGRMKACIRWERRERERWGGQVLISSTGFKHEEKKGGNFKQKEGAQGHESTVVERGE